MIVKKLLAIIFLFGLIGSVGVIAQNNSNGNLGLEKIRGVSHYTYPSYSGFPFMNTYWVSGNVIFNNGELSDSIRFRYSSYKDEVIYFNETNNRQIVIDKISIKGFVFNSEFGIRREFRKQYYDNFPSGDRFFEVLSVGEVDLLAFKSVSLISTSAYKDESGIFKNMMYSNDYQYYFWSSDKGYMHVKLNTGSFISKFAKTDQKQIKKLIRKSRLDLNSESDLVLAWKLVEAEGYKVAF